MSNPELPTPETPRKPSSPLTAANATSARPQVVAAATSNNLSAGGAMSDWFFRSVIAVLILGSLSLAWWSFAVRLLPLQQRSRELSLKVARLSAEVDAQERLWAGEHEQLISNRLTEAQSRLFADQEALESWLANLKEQALPLALDTKTDFSKNVTPLPSEADLALIATTISVDVQSASPEAGYESPYQRILRLAQRLADSEKRADLTGLRVLSGTNSVAKAVMVFHLWAGQEAPL